MSQRNGRVHKQEGMALVLTLMAVSFLVAITVQITTSVNWQMQGAGNLRDSVQLDAINRSGLNLIRAALAADFKANKYDSEHDSWNTLDKEKMSSLFGQGAVEVEVTDLTGLLQVNALVPDKADPQFQAKQNAQIGLWQRFLTPANFAVDDAAEADAVIDAIIDWIDPDDDVRNNGAESGHYQALSPPYEARNGYVTYPEELLLIRGMTKDLFYGNEQNSDLPLKDFLTVAGHEGIININSAPKQLLMALDPHSNMTEQNADDLIEYRGEENNKPKLADPRWYKLVNRSLDLDENIFDVKSSYFKVSVAAKHKSMTRSATGILERDVNKGEQKLLYWEVR